GAGDFGGVLQSGTIVLAAGQSTADLDIATPATLTLPNEKLDVQISISTPGPILSNAHGTADLHSGLPVHGIDGDPQFAIGGNLPFAHLITQSGTSAVLDLGTIGANGITAFNLILQNIVAGFGNNLSGSFATSGSGFSFGNLGSLSLLAPGNAFTGITVNAGTGLGSHSATLVFNPTSFNDSGFSGILPAETPTIIDTGVAA